MSNTFIFIIPLTPDSYLTSLRRELQQLCIKSLLSQSNTNWKALLIGADKPDGVEDERFIHLPVEGYKELKLQHAAKYIIDTTIKIDYVIRLDDDDIINPFILEYYKSSQSDVIVDLNQWFIEWDSKAISKDFKPWFANTIFHKKEHAIAQFGKIARKGVPNINKYVPLIATNHALIHKYYKEKKIEYAPSNKPIYLRVINQDSITSNSGQKYQEYLKSFGNWKESLPVNFEILKFGESGGYDIGEFPRTLKQLLHTKLSILKFKKELR